MAEGSEMLTYLLYAVLVVVMGIAGWYIAKMWGDDKVYIGAGIGALLGAAVAYGISYYNGSSSTSSATAGLPIY